MSSILLFIFYAIFIFDSSPSLSTQSEWSGGLLKTLSIGRISLPTYFQDYFKLGSRAAITHFGLILTYGVDQAAKLGHFPPPNKLIIVDHNGLLTELQIRAGREVLVWWWYITQGTGVAAVCLVNTWCQRYHLHLMGCCWAHLTLWFDRSDRKLVTDIHVSDGLSHVFCERRVS